jgi:phosphoglycerol transferase
MSINSSLTVLSAILFTAGLYLFKKTRLSKVGIGLFLVMASCSAFLFIVYGAAYYFTGNGIDEATMYHLEYGLDGAGFLEYGGLIATIGALIIGFMCLLWYILKKANNEKPHIMKSVLSYFLLSASLFLNPATLDIYKLQKESLILDSQPQSATDFYDYYRNPHISARPSSSQKNLVFIYAESLERTYFDETLFPGLIKGLREIESKSTYFTNIRQVTRTGWTMGGMTASLCGIPLFTPSHGNSMAGMDQFLSSVVCLGDLLKNKGYHLTYMGGASLDFAGKGKLFKTHGFTDVLGREELVPRLENKNYKTDWGLYDDSLFDMVYNRFIELSEQGGKFAIFTLTLDTHHPNGHPSKSCKDIKYKDGSNSILNAVACSDCLITKFIKKIIKSPYADKTVVVLVSDHLALRNTASDLLQKRNRRNLFMIIDPNKKKSKEVRAVGSTLDIGTTLLPFIGYNGDIGLGRNLLSATEPEKDRRYIHANLRKWKREIVKFWNFPTIQSTIEINIDAKIVRIDKRSFRIPILIELNNKLESTLKFQFYKSKGLKSLVQHRKALDENKYFLFIDRCEDVRELDKTLGKDGFCLLAGQGRKYTKITKLNKNITYTVNEIRKLLKMKKEKK